MLESFGPNNFCPPREVDSFCPSFAQLSKILRDDQARNQILNTGGGGAFF